jgi:hypothetical protein
MHDRFNRQTDGQFISIKWGLWAHDDIITEYLKINNSVYANIQNIITLQE